MTLSLSPSPKIQFFGNNGLPLAGGYLYTYLAGTPATPKTTYVDSSGTPNTNPVVLDSAGRCSLWLDGYYYMELWTGDKNAAGSTLLWTQDNVSTGSVVYAGPQGITGAQGPQGIDGTQGAQGALGTQGYQGNQGITGSQGPQGATGNQGAQGALGTQGFQGFAGVQGAQGIAGAGLNQRGPWASGSDYVVGDAVSDTGNYYVCIVDVINSTTSPPGDAVHFNLVAAQGAQGAQGAVGPQGNAGPQGNVGSQGTAGAQGNQGFQGATGAQGAIGPQGNIGSQGATGSQGYMGVQGSVGPQGGAGPAGAQGASGPQGFAGAQGTVGPQGSIGSAGVLVYGPTNYLISNATHTALVFGTEVFDNNSIHSTSVNPSRLTVPTGVTAVRVTGQVVFAANAVGARRVIFRKNASEVFAGNVYFYGPAVSGGFGTVVNLTTPVIQVVAGDYFEFYVYQSSGGSLQVDVASDQTWFGMEA